MPTSTTQPDLEPQRLTGARLPRWCLPADWPSRGTEPALADVDLADGRIASIAPAAGDAAVVPGLENRGAWRLDGAPVLPGLVDAHTHLDKTFTLARLGNIRPGLLGAIEAMHLDRPAWTTADVRQRAGKALQWAWHAGVVRLRTHVDWWEPDAEPVAWRALASLAHEWAGRIAVERVALIPLTLFARRDAARALARRVVASGAGALLGGFVHTSNWNPQALAHLLEAAADAGLDVDLHIDEELNPAARGLASVAARARELRFGGRIVCGHCCALAAQPEAEALATLDAVAEAPITLVSLPITNLLLQDAAAGRTPRRRGLTLVKEARARGIPVLIGSDNVQDPFCPIGSYDPVEALSAGVLAGQLDAPFDRWSEAICRGDWLGGPLAPPLQPGAPADLVVFTAAEAAGFPSRAQPRVVIRGGRVVDAADGATSRIAA